MCKIAVAMVALSSEDNGDIQLDINGVLCSLEQWVVRVHLLPEQTASKVLVNGVSVEAEYIKPQSTCSQDFFPLQGPKSQPACRAGVVL